MEATIYIEVKSVYGKETLYPACNLSAQLAAFKGQTTLTRGDIAKLKEMGFNVLPSVTLAKF